MRNLEKAREWAKSNKWLTTISAFAVIVLVLFCVAAYTAYDTNEVNKRLSNELDDAWGTVDSLREENGYLEMENDRFGSWYLEENEANLLLREEKEKLEKENSQLLQDLEKRNEDYKEQSERFASFDKDYSKVLKNSAHFCICGKAVVKNELTDKEEEIEIHEYLLAIPGNATFPAEYSLLWNKGEVIDLNLEVTSSEGELSLNYEKSSSISATGIYVVTVVGNGGSYEATVVVGKDHRGIDLTPKMHVTIW